ncbi:MAG: exodeoxyribonuclease V subunit gamma [Betaproteobacteria bacterium]|nr:exodeoxyribonuclease V subunit gamma [Betaproteobacteria bacterium]
MLYLHTSNRYEILRELLLTHLAAAPENPFALQEIIVPNTAIQSDLERALADKHGVAAGVLFSFPGRWLWQRITALLPDVAQDSPFAPERSVWRITRLLADNAFIQQAPALLNYLADADPLMRHELAARIAALFSAYAIYRPDYLTIWQAGRTIKTGHPLPHESWQAELWRKLAAELGLTAEHPASLFFAALADAADNAAEKLGLAHDHGSQRSPAIYGGASETVDYGAEGSPNQWRGSPNLQVGVTHLSVFCLHELPPLYLEMLTRIAEWVDVRLYLLNPCREYWTDLPTTKNRARLEALGRADFLPPVHPLLTDWGRQTQTLFTMLLENDAVAETEHFKPGAGKSLLIRLQNSILDGEPPAPGAWPLSDTDRSVEIHVAHSLFRQLEILRDQLLARLATIPLPQAGEESKAPSPTRFDATSGRGEQSPLTLADIVVLLPDLESAAPWIEAVFTRDAPRIPYTITGYAAARKNTIARLLLALLNLAAPGSRLPASEVFAFVREFAALLGLSADEAESLCAALKEAGARWGMDATDARVARHTWRDALARLFLGYALPAQHGGATSTAEPFQGLLPAGNLAGSRARILGSAWLFLERLEKLHKAMRNPLAAESWRELWQQTLDEWLDDGKGMSAIANTPDMTADAALRQTIAAIHTLCDNMAAADDLPIPAEVALAALEQALQTEAFGAKPSGALTFAPLFALRSLPYRMICVLGLEDGVFPRRSQASEFDLMPLLPRLGDKRQNLDERNLFLDTILSARETLYLGYSGRSQRDDGELPPSLPLAELRDFLNKATGAPPERLQVIHPLQAFSPEYFSGDPRLMSFRQDYAEALQHASGRGEAAPFFSAPLPSSGDKRLWLPELQAFFQHPARALLMNQLGIRLPDAADETEDIEPQTALPLPRYNLNQRLLTAALSGADEERIFRLATSGVEYPGGRFGEALLTTETKAVIAYAKRLLPYWRKREKRDISLAVHEHLLTASLADLTPDGLIAFRYANVRGRDYISTWLAHLVLNADGGMLRTRFFARDQDFSFAPLAQDEATARLADWLTAWQDGCQKPLAFYPETAWVWQRQGEAAGRRKWLGSDYSRAEADNLWRLALGNSALEDALNDDFAHWRERLLSPLEQYLQPLPEQP